MARPSASTRRRIRPSTWIGAGSVTAVVALVATLAVVWPGYDAQQTPVANPSVWALQEGAGGGYARVNLDLGEIDTVKRVENAADIVQSGDELFVYTDGGAQFADVDPARPTDLTADADDAFQSTPAGTADIAAAGDVVAYRTDSGAVFGATLSGGGAAVPVDPYADVETADDEERPRFVATAVAAAEDGSVYAYLAAESRVVRADGATGRVLGEDATATAPTEVQLTVVGTRWVLLDEATGDVLVRGRDEPIASDAGTGALLQASAPRGSVAYVADTAGLVRIGLDDGAVERVVAENGIGTPAAPTSLDDVVHAAWLGEGESGGSLWRSDDGSLTDLAYGGADIGDTVAPAFAGNGSRLALNDRGSGWVWTVPDGSLVASSQQWDLQARTDVQQDQQATAERVLDPKPPVAVDDAFGVRADAVVLLPVLLNDHDPNEDVLSIDVASLEGLDPAFGSVAVTGAEQQVALTVTPDATGSATFRYRVTDGTSTAGLYSESATVTVTVVADEQNSAPVWCGVEGCLHPWPTLSANPGGTVSAELLEGWVDPDGDPVYLAGATNDSGVGTVTTSPEGTLTYQHPDPSATEPLTVSLGVTVSDARGATTTQALAIEVTPAPELTADSFAVTGVVGEPLEISVTSHVTGAAGPLTLAGVVALDPARSTASANPAAVGFAFTATEPGSYLVEYTVRDPLGEATATVRVTMLSPETATISTPPLTAFVRPNEDATVDVFPAVANPAGLVLLLSDIRPESDPFAALGVDSVGQSLLRVSGSTDDAQPGRLGVVRYTVSDGTGRPEATAQGELTVILLPEASAEPPIAVDDAVTVRAGTQIDIPVLDNDSAPSGAPLAIDPSSIVDETGGGLAFATTRVLRYLAPSQAGTYALSYTVSRVGFPEAVDTARVTVTVVGDEANQAPLPRTLVGRVLSGQSVSIPLDAYAVDPDGDAVTLDRIVEQPETGSATISADGSAIVYSSPDGFSGQVRFRYQVRDPEGATGTADVRVGVIDTQADPRPVTYSDYVQVQAGPEGVAVVRPIENDIDPAGGEIELVGVTPNAPADSPEYAALQARIESVEDGVVRLRAGEDLGTVSYTYTVRGERGDTAMGLIVLKVVRSPVPDYPAVSDTLLTIEDRDQFPAGVDVLSGHVTWNTGDVSALRLSLWGDPAGVRASGSRISGELPERTRIIPFAVTGAAFDGEEVTSYGFLRVPGDADIRLALREGLPPLQVTEKQSVDFDLADGVSVPRGRSLVIDDSGVRAGGARAAASCTLVSGTTVRYTAGTGAPFSDSCVVPVRMDVQDAYTYLTLPVSIDAEIPQPTLRSASISVSPGTSQTYDLAQMVQWAGREDWSAVQYAAAASGDQFTVSQSGASVTVTATDAARPGRTEAVSVTLPSHPEARPANLVLTVGPAPSTLPKGGSAVQTCSQSGGSTSCTIEVIGAGGEVNPLPGTPLRVVSASSAGSCRGVEFARASDTAVRARWASDAAGAAECVGSFVVEDAQGRQSSGGRNGQVILDLQGLPATPARLEWTAYGADSVTLRVVADAASYPAVDGYRVTVDGREIASCPASGVCAPFSAPVGEKVTYEARAFSDVGSSRSAVRAQAWAYRPPSQPASATAEPVPAGNVGERATIVVDGLDSTTGSVRLSGGAQGSDTQPVVAGTATFRDYAVGSNSPTALQATPLTTFDLPPVAAGSSEGRALEVRASGIGAPTVGLALAQSDDGRRVTATATATPNGVGDRMRVGFAAGAEECRAAAGETVSASGGTLTRVFTDLPLWTEATVRACVITERGADTFGDGAPTTKTITPRGVIEAPQGRATYGIGGDPEVSGDRGTWTWSEITPPDLRASGPFEVRYRAGAGAWTTDFRSLFRLGVPAGEIRAAQCSDAFACGDATAVVVRPADDGARYTARVEFDYSCRSGQTEPRGSVDVLANPSDYRVLEPTVETEALRSVFTYVVEFRGALASLGTAEYAVICVLPDPGDGDEPPIGDTP